MGPTEPLKLYFKLFFQKVLKQAVVNQHRYHYFSKGFVPFKVKMRIKVTMNGGGIQQT